MDIIKTQLLEGFNSLVGGRDVDRKKIETVCDYQFDSLPDSPVKVVEAAYGIGLEVYKATLPDGISGMLKRKERKIYVEGSDSEERQRFTCAHEIGHFILHEEDYYNNVLFRSLIANVLEKEANTMAAEILMPRYFVEKFADSDMALEEIAGKFKVSRSAAEFRIKNIMGEKFYAKKYSEC